MLYEKKNGILIRPRKTYVGGGNEVVHLFVVIPNLGRRCGLMFSALDSGRASGTSGLGSNAGRAGVMVLWSWIRHFTLTVNFYTQEYK